MNNVLYIINPAGRGGAGTRAWEAFRSQWSSPIDTENVFVTEAPGHAREIATTAEGYDTFAVVGGDGTVGEVLSAILDRDQPELKLGIIPAGTGNDIGRNVGIYSIEDAVLALRNGRLREFDILRVDSFMGDKPIHSYGFLACGIGFSSIPKIRPWMKRLLGPAGAYYLATLIQLLVYQPTRITMRSDFRDYSGRTWLIMVGNVEAMSGGSMCLAPGALPDDGELNISIFPDGSRFKMGSKFMPKIASGDHVNEPEILYFTGKTIEIDSDPPAVIDLDGDLRGTTPATIAVCPRAIRILTPDKEHGSTV